MAGTVIEVLRRFLPFFLKTRPVLSNDQQRAIWAIEHCRTSALGWDVYECNDCGERLFIAHWKNYLKDLQWTVDPVVWNKQWGVYIKPFGTGANAVKYLGAYVNRTAIGDSRILEINDETVRFSWKDRSDGDKVKELTLTGNQFLERYLRHVLPKNLRSIRYYGFCHPAAKKNREKIQFYSGKPLLVGQLENPTYNLKLSQDYVCNKCSKPMDRTFTVGRDGKIKAHLLRGPPYGNTHVRNQTA